MTPQQIQSLIQQGEGYNVEFKQSASKEIAEEICAFANAAGGTLLIGVDDKGVIIGASLDNQNKSRLQDTLKKIEPNFPVTISEVKIQDKTVIAIECQSGNQKPYTVSGAIIIRNGPNSEKITSVQRMRDFFQQSDRIFFDEAECKSFNFKKDFNQTYFQEFLQASNISNNLEQDTILQNLKLFTENNGIKNAAALFFSLNPQKHFEWATTRCTLFKGIDKHHIIDDKIFGGNLINQYDEALKYIYSKMNVEYVIKDAKPRKEIWEIPDVALKEALINALAHRDYYERGARITIEIFENRIEISNPGGLVNSIPKNQFGKRSLSRNPLIFGLFQRLNLVEQIGSGINRIKNAMVEASLEEPLFNLDGMFSVTLFRPISFEKLMETYWSPFLNNSQYQILWEIYRNNKITKSQLIPILGIGKTAIDKNIEKLKELGILERIGSDRSGSWKIIPKRYISG